MTKRGIEDVARASVTRSTLGKSRAQNEFLNVGRSYNNHIILDEFPRAGVPYLIRELGELR